MEEILHQLISSFSPLFSGSFTSQVVQDFFHQQYESKRESSPKIRVNIKSTTKCEKYNINILTIYIYTIHYRNHKTPPPDGGSPSSVGIPFSQGWASHGTSWWTWWKCANTLGKPSCWGVRRPCHGHYFHPCLLMNRDFGGTMTGVYLWVHCF